MHGYIVSTDDGRILSNGHIALEVPSDYPVKPAKVQPKLLELWSQALLEPITPSSLGKICAATSDLSRHYRKIGDHIFSEHYIRCFQGPNVTWTVSQGRALAHDQEGKLIGIVMQCRFSDEIPSENQEPSDYEVFAPFSGPENDWYLVNAPTLKSRLKIVQEQRDIAEEKVREAEVELREAEAELTEIEQELATLETRTARQLWPKE